MSVLLIHLLLRNEILGALISSATIALLILHIHRIRREAVLIRQLTEISETMAENCDNLRHLNYRSSVVFRLSMAINQLAGNYQNLKIASVRTEKARKRLLTNISHDIRTPLTSISGYIEALRDGVCDSEEEEREYIHILSDKSAKLIRVVNSIFELAKIEAEDIEIKPVKFDINRVLEEIAIDYIPRMKEEGVEFINLINRDIFTVKADLMSIQRVLNNLIENALTHGRSGRTLGISTESGSNGISCTVWDCGPGIPKEEAANIFSRLYSSSGSRKNSGLGLEISKKLAERNGAELSFTSIPDERTAFKLFFPAG